MKIYQKTSDILYRNRNMVRILAILLIMSSCSPVNRFTHLKKVPKKYSINYCVPDIKVKKEHRMNHDPWMVYSDKKQNTYVRPGGKVTLKEVEFMSPLLVIKEKRDYLKVIKYSKEIVKDGKLSDRKKAEYCGWIAKSDVLLYRNASTDIASGRNTKMLAIINDTSAIFHSAQWIQNDSLLCFSGEDMRNIHRKIPFYGIVYPMKRSRDRNKILISQVPYLSTDSASHEIIGWVDDAMVRNAGQQLHVELDKLPQQNIAFRKREEHTFFDISKEALNDGYERQHSLNALKYSPVTDFKRSDSTILLKTGLPFAALDYSSNYVLNVNGHKIFYNQFQELRRNLHRINLVFVFEGKKEVLSRYPELVNSIQNLQSRLEDDSYYSFSVGAVLGFEGRSKEMPVYGPTSDFIVFMDSLSRGVNNADELRPLESEKSWPALRKAIQLFDGKKQESNILIIIGETGYNNENTDTALLEQISELNCKILAFQLYGGEPNTYNNFVLQIENMIEAYAKKIAVEKREIIVSPQKLRKSNDFKESAKNVFCLDFPEKSMTQGWILFPEKKQAMDLSTFTNCTDSLIMEIKEDNLSIITSLNEAFNQVGNYRNQYDSIMVTYYGMKPHSRLKVSFADQFKKQLPYWYLPSTLIMPDSLEQQINGHLLLNEGELTELRSFLNDISSEQADFKHKKGKKRSEKKVCNCPDDDLTFQEVPEDTLEQRKYLGTRKIRNRLVKKYLKFVDKYQYCKVGKKKLKRESVARIHERITTCPTKNYLLNYYSLKDLRKKKKMSNEILDYILEYYKRKRDELENNLNVIPTFYSNGETYYWVNDSLLP